MEGLNAVTFACETKHEVEFNHLVVPALSQLGVGVVSLHHDEHSGALDVVLSLGEDGPSVVDGVLMALSEFELRFDHEVVTNPTFVWADVETMISI